MLVSTHRGIHGEFRRRKACTGIQQHPFERRRDMSWLRFQDIQNPEQWYRGNNMTRIDHACPPGCHTCRVWSGPVDLDLADVRVPPVLVVGQHCYLHHKGSQTCCQCKQKTARDQFADNAVRVESFWREKNRRAMSLRHRQMATSLFCLMGP